MLTMSSVDFKQGFFVFPRFDEYFFPSKMIINLNFKVSKFNSRDPGSAKTFTDFFNQITGSLLNEGMFRN